MKLNPTIDENRKADTRLKSRDPASAQAASQGAVFGQVLAGVEGQASASTTHLATTTPARGDNALPASALDSKGTSTGMPGKPTSDATTDTAVGSLLKRIKAKQDAVDAQGASANAATTPAPGTTGAVPLVFDLRPPTVSAGNGAGPTGDGAPSHATSATGALISLAQPTTGSANGTAAPPTDTGISDVSIATHVAPTEGRALPVSTPEGTGTTPGQAIVATKEIAQAGASPSPDVQVQAEAQAGVQTASSNPGDAGTQANPDQGKPKDGATTMAVSPDAGGAAQRDAPRDDDGSDALVQKPVDGPLAPVAPTVAPHAAVKSIANAVVELAAQAPAAAPAETPKPHASMARTVTLQMSPADLGTVEVRLHMSGHALDLHLTISERETVGLVTRERDTLATALQGHGYDLHSLVIQDAGAAVSSGGSNVTHQHASANAQPEHQNDAGGERAQTGGQRGDQDSGRRSYGDARSNEPQEPSSDRTTDRLSLFV